ncbi:CtsR family transcriptional regulator [Pectinatus cerevisiiphilus]|uniref:Transcriptional regulator CtsR n=1 Tax=Pectinatus cerevisiiphilus TaxID=86956 RepID=A0A4R3K4B1_9FIRM|nr:CtsR family transcriptional regulator [Pectinatus cerevisiiphilus]TCS77507.1 transcriptional regulator CtsR [Pectinatus cerevisiiphilus]
MSNIADLIEHYILQRLAAQQNCNVILKRADIADVIECAPSQISYVLNTRFTSDKGFIVESRRGLGGFIRITRVPLQDLVYGDLINKINNETTVKDLHNMIDYMLKHNLIKNREAALIYQSFNNIYNKISASDRANFLRSLFITLADFTEEE